MSAAWAVTSLRDQRSKHETHGLPVTRPEQWPDVSREADRFAGPGQGGLRGVLPALFLGARRGRGGWAGGAPAPARHHRIRRRARRSATG